MAAAAVPGSPELQPSMNLRAELKHWEETFAATNSGRKPSREDIKKHPEIAQKYKVYSKIKEGPSKAIGSSPPPTKRRKPSPPKRECRSQPRASELDLYDSPRRSLDIHLTPSHHNVRHVGPTPQRNGMVLGLFDFLSPDFVKVGTPSKGPKVVSSGADLQATPSKRKSICNLSYDMRLSGTNENTGRTTTMQSPLRPSRTPQSSTKRAYLSQFLAMSTPSRNRTLGIDHQTPSSSSRRTGVSKLKFDDTPQYLRRIVPRVFSGQMEIRKNNSSELDQLLEGDMVRSTSSIQWSPIAVRLPAKPIGKGLSALVKGLRDAEDERLDGDLELLRGLEAGDDIPARTTSPSINKSAKAQRPKLLVQDSQMEAPLGPDRNLTEDLDELEEDENPANVFRRKAWKKKGQKRSTKRVIMRPVTEKWKPEKDWNGPIIEESDKEDSESLAPRKLSARPLAPKIEESDDEPNADESKGKPGEQGTEGHGVKKNSALEKAKLKKLEVVDVSTDVAKKGKKKGAVQQANFRALKIKNKNSKGNKFGGGRRFGRGR
ncbi:DNA replication regulator sld2 [Agyrium rufum]|nr:DNA replication regulator sld2 [Agyrium rufum]